ncbi:PDZ domain-containing protein [Mycolicibacterium brumae]|uniref:endopeptidase La n=2 Tax=Mycolicibacterium brumae TaxID=85968 RepID=A0A2G5PCA1_9MYCO|nr:PDZ domain-containing protein [Mycolicibacterium brumae]RWA16598.1 hypothetical protein MBRU_07695 [Mycolicibacterium brumae DSM 44177]
MTLLVALAPILVFGLFLSSVKVPFVSLGPGPTFDTLGEYDGKKVVDIEGVATKQYAGHLNMTTVAQRDGLTLAQALVMWASGRDQIVPRALVYPPDKSKDEIDAGNASDFKNSEDNAEYAALDYLKYPKLAVVRNVADDGAAKGKLQAGDALIGVDGHPVATVEEFTDRLKGAKPGQDVVIDYQRKNTAEPGSTTITLGDGPEAGRGYVGVGVLDAPWVPFVITFNLANIGGPSAGLMFSLAVVDKLTDGDLNGGRFVAGSGTITPGGEVGPIGGISHKIEAAAEAGATVFMVPADNCTDARQGAPDGIELVKVDTLTTAVDALKAITDGGEPPRC